MLQGMAAAKKPAAKAPAKPPVDIVARERRPVTDLDHAITRALDGLRLTRFRGQVTRKDLAIAAVGRAHHALRMMREAGPRQSWSVNELAAYARALDVSVSTVLMAAGVELPDATIEEAILADATLAPSDKGTLIGLVQTMRRGQPGRA